jgi:hypothetical protein
VLGVLAVGVLGVLAYSYATRTPPEPDRAPDAADLAHSPSEADAQAETGAHAQPPDASASLSHEAAKAEITSDTIAAWIGEATGADPKKRAAAIIALAQAPKAAAVPTLREVLDVGEPEPDRQLALHSLHALAIEQGDEDGQIRDTLRFAMYHGDDDGVSQSAQAYLEDIESALDEQATEP